MITFIYNGSTYYAEEGMTWEEWVNNETYNTAGFSVQAVNSLPSGVGIICGIDNYLSVSSSSKDAVLPSDKIIAGTTYHNVSSWSGGSAY